MRHTKNLGLNLPEPDDFYDIQHQNENMNIIDEKVNNLKIKLGKVTDLVIKNEDKRITIWWNDPKDIILGDIAFAIWKCTKLVVNEEHYPQNEKDGTILLEETVKNQYSKNGYTVSNLENGHTYYFCLFPCTDDNIYTYDISNRFLGQPNYLPDPCTNLSIVEVSEGQVTLKWIDPDATKVVDDNIVEFGKTVVVYKEGIEAPETINDGIIAVEETIRNQYAQSGYTISELENGKDYSFSAFAVSSDNVPAMPVSVKVEMYAQLEITTTDESLYNKEVIVNKNSNNVTGTFNSNGIAIVKVPWVGDTRIFVNDNNETKVSINKVNIEKFGGKYKTGTDFFKVVTFANGSDDDIVNMLSAHYQDKINIADFWAVGDKRKVSLSAMSATYVGESHRAQTVEFAIADFEHDDLTTAINGHKKAAVTLVQVDCLMSAECEAGTRVGKNNSENGYMNSSNTNVGGWGKCARRTWCNNVYYNALPTKIKSIVKEVIKKTSAGNESKNIVTSNDKVFLASGIEIHNNSTYASDGEGVQYQYYKNLTANIYKKPAFDVNYESAAYWKRSPVSTATDSFATVSVAGGPGWYEASEYKGIAPCICI